MGTPKFFYDNTHKDVTQTIAFDADGRLVVTDITTVTNTVDKARARSFLNGLKLEKQNAILERVRSKVVADIDIQNWQDEIVKIDDAITKIPR